MVQLVDPTGHSVGTGDVTTGATGSKIAVYFPNLAGVTASGDFTLSLPNSGTELAKVPVMVTLVPNIQSGNPATYTQKSKTGNCDFTLGGIAAQGAEYRRNA